MVTNPADYLTKKFQQLANHNLQKIAGFGGILDSARFAQCFKRKLELVEELRVHSLTGDMVGYHNQDMFLLSKSVNINGIPVDEFTAPSKGLLEASKYDALRVAALVETLHFGANVTSLNKGKMGSSIGPGTLLAKFIIHYCFKRPSPLSASFTTFVAKDSEAGKFYGVNDTYFSLPMTVSNGKLTVLCQHKLTLAEENARDFAIKNFNSTALRLDALILQETTSKASNVPTPTTAAAEPTKNLLMLQEYQKPKTDKMPKNAAANAASASFTASASK